MKQFHVAYHNDTTFLNELEKIRQWRGSHRAYTTVFHIYCEDLNPALIAHICGILDTEMPDDLYLGCISNANILEGSLAKERYLITCTVFEYETTQAALLQYPFREENSREDVQNLIRFCESNPWVGSVEMLATIMGMSMKPFCDEMDRLPAHIQVFGGGACNPDLDNAAAGVFSKGNGFLAQGIVFLLLGGPDFHVHNMFISGWKPLDRRFHITRAVRETLYELDGQPALNIYRKYLNIENNENFVSNTLEFPLFIDHDGIDMLRCPLAVNDDGSLVMASDVEENTSVRLAYGDPETILHTICLDGQKVADFQPQAILTFSCAARRAFWGDANVSKETEPFQKIAPTTGFYTHGEFLRLQGRMLNFNVTLVIAAMREGDAPASEPVRLYKEDLKNLSKVPILWRFVSFIEASTADLEESNFKLTIAAITDGLTRLNNRTEIERQLSRALEEFNRGDTDGSLSLIMLDIDNFKMVNDIYGHQAGDLVIKTLADILRRTVVAVHSSSTGRWGGEEFMVLLSESGEAEAAEVAEQIRIRFANASFIGIPSQTVSIGVTQAKRGESTDTLCSRVDQALYKAKQEGKNRVVCL